MIVRAAYLLLALVLAPALFARVWPVTNTGELRDAQEGSAAGDELAVRGTVAGDLALKAGQTLRGDQTAVLRGRVTGTGDVTLRELKIEGDVRVTDATSVTVDRAQLTGAVELVTVKNLLIDRSALRGKTSLVAASGDHTVDVRGSTFTGNPQALLVTARGDAKLTLTVADSQFNGVASNAIHLVGEEHATATFTLRKNRMTKSGSGIVIAVSGDANVTGRVEANTMTDSTATPIAVNAHGGSVTATILDNNLRGCVNCSGFLLATARRARGSIVVTGNTVERADGNAVRIIAGDQSTLAVRLTSNTFQKPAGEGKQGILATIGTTSTSTASLCLDLGGVAKLANTIQWSAPSMLWSRFPGATLTLAGYTGDRADVAAIGTWVAAQNKNAPMTVKLAADLVAANCELP
ncbi:MAG TPA: right-handed parallel beta-helix repeat-containing protein [Thermoanaerobaculia bacterium]